MSASDIVFSGNVSFAGADTKAVTQLNEFTGSIRIIAGPNITINSGSGIIAITGSAAVGDTTALNEFSQSVNLFTASINSLTQSLNSFTASFNSLSQSINGFTASFSASVQSIGDARYANITNFNNFVSTTNTLTQSLNIFSASINTFSQSVNGFTASFTASVQSIGDTRYANLTTFNNFVSTTNTLTQSLNLFSATINTFSQSMNGFTASFSASVVSIGNLHWLTGSTASADNAIPVYDGTSGKIIQSSSVLISDDSELYNFKGLVSASNGVTFTPSVSDSGKIIELSASTGAQINFYLPNNLPKGWNATVVQMASASLIHFSTSAGSILRCFNNLSKSAGWYAESTLYVSSNTTGVSASYVLGGNLV